MRYTSGSWATLRGLHSDRPNALPNERRGWLTAVLSAAPAVASTVGAFTGTNAKDQERAATAQAWYQEAIKGDIDALNALKFMSGRFGPGNCGRYGPCSGFATQAAKDYDYKLYQQAVQVIQGQLPQSVPVPTTPAATTPNPVSVTYVPPGASGPGSAGGVTVQSGPTTFQSGAGAVPTDQQRRTNTMLWVLVGVIALGGIAVYMTRKRG